MSLTIAPETIEFFAHVAIDEVTETLTQQQRGRVRFMATYWFARFYDLNFATQALPGTSVKVIGWEGLTLLVVPSDDQRIYPLMPKSGRPECNQLGLLGWMGSQFANWLN
jgi:hypothetical protein